MLNTFLVGGAIRDNLLGLSCKEFDWVIVNSEIINVVELGFKKVGKDFPVFLHPFNKEEYSLARKEKKVGKGYYGFKCDFSFYVSLNEDLLRRDLTINTFVLNEIGIFIDFFSGKEDLKNKKFLHVSLAFFEDPLRILRVFRFYVRYFDLGFNISSYTKSFIRKIVFNSEIFCLTFERIFKEIFLSLEYRYSFLFFVYLYKFRVLKAIFYDLDLLFCFSKNHFFNIYLNLIQQINILFLNIHFYSNNIFLKFSLLFYKLSFRLCTYYNLNYFFYHNKKILLIINRYSKDFNFSKKYKNFLLNLFKFRYFFINSFLISNYFLFLFFCKMNAFKDKIKLVNYILINDLDSKFNEKIYNFHYKYLFLDLLQIISNYKNSNCISINVGYNFYYLYFKCKFFNIKFYYNKYF